MTSLTEKPAYRPGRTSPGTRLLLLGTGARSDRLCSHLAARVPAVVSVEDRLAPEHSLPASAEDAPPGQDEGRRQAAEVVIHEGREVRHVAHVLAFVGDRLRREGAAV
ncbi:alpha/beta hydrolase fold domain-containing protein [Nonomuraea sp. SYSU D8015]|uniref:alpha/beta hydrolase fold domain-containing protein n=1 Tax=Nonomuraea sp. SYSU D8015 TaxID=2593644 RepID=UPI0016612E5C|nr:alpha/beta hydrolase fold domain-containing protein [Nonomuraea sp. SYSU D8015]